MMKGKVIFLRRVNSRPEEMSDRALIAACSKGDKAALSALFDRYYQIVYRFLFRAACTTSQDLDDLAQTTFIELQRSAEKYRGNSTVKTWILGIAANVARHYKRGEVRRKRLSDSLCEIPYSEDLESPYKIVERKQRLSRLNAGLKALPDSLRIAFVLCDLEELSGAETAHILGIRQGTLWRRLYEARRALCKAIDEKAERIRRNDD